MLVPQVDELVVFNRPMPLNQLSVAGVSREPGSTLERQRLALENQLTANGLAEQSWQLSNGLAEQRWRAGSSQCLANLNSWPSRLSLVEWTTLLKLSWLRSILILQQLQEGRTSNRPNVANHQSWSAEWFQLNSQHRKSKVQILKWPSLCLLRIIHDHDKKGLHCITHTFMLFVQGVSVRGHHIKTYHIFMHQFHHILLLKH